MPKGPGNRNKQVSLYLFRFNRVQNQDINSITYALVKLMPHLPPTGDRWGLDLKLLPYLGDLEV